MSDRHVTKVSVNVDAGESERKQMASKKPNQKLGQTLHDLEAAFADWEALSDTPVAPQAAPSAAPVTGSIAVLPRDLALRQKTKMLLDQLRQQLSDLDE